ncbi:MAG TPA: TolC family protein, partial [Thioalkalivibrio sp.]|nr:TolC family protein [Thioalkalivibrio sp.]
EAVSVATELAERMTRVGNWGQDRLLREQRALAESNLRLAQARQTAVNTREALVRTLGLWSEAASFSLPDRLPDLPEAPLEGDGLESAALQAHPELSLAAIDAERAQRALGSRTRDMWNEAREDALSGLFDPLADGNPLEHRVATAPRLDRRLLPPGHDAERAAKAEAKALALAVRIRSQVREAYHQYRIAHDLARNAREAERVSVALQEETLLRYNGMLKSTWDLLAAARERVESEGAAAQAQRDFWLAHANLQAVLAGAGYPGPDSISVGGGRAQDGGGH